MVDTFKDLKCPACQSVMTKIFIPKEGVNIDICLDGCGGVYFDNRELTYFDEYNESVDDILEAVKNKEFKHVETSNRRCCPACGANMVKNYTSINKEVEIDECYSCGGKFLDNGELEKLREEYDTHAERSQDVLNYVYANVGGQIQALEKEVEMRKSQRSFIAKLVRKVFDY